MKAKLIAQIIIYLVLLFGLGGVCGYAMSNQVQPRRPAWTQSKEWAARWIDHRMSADFAAIQATPEQQEQLRPIYEQLLADFSIIQEESAQKVGAAFKRHGTEMWKQLTPEQREQLRRINQERLQRGKKS